MLRTFKEAPLEPYFEAVTRNALLRRVRPIVGDADAEDVVQDTYEKAWKATTARAGSDLRPWLHRIARNTALDRLRTKQATAVADVPEGTDESAEASVLRQEARVDLATALRHLPPAQRRTIVLHDVAGYTSHEIASLDAIPYHTVRTRLFRARRAMRDALTTQAA
ncbi:MAG TPA: RNA polymerase sigma factor [Candidatus Limnocylindria bacterium]|nr:RNA polymerase sigma factor [Candidatus Limnocylindria bacterium]